MSEREAMRRRYPFSLLVAAVAFFACSVQKAPTPEEFDAWSRVRFPPELLAKVSSGDIRFEGGDGTSQEAAVIIAGTTDGRLGVPAEYLWIARKHGIQGRDWQPAMQSVSRPNPEGRRFDILTIDVAGKWTSTTYYFDISEFYGKEVNWFFQSK